MKISSSNGDPPVFETPDLLLVSLENIDNGIFVRSTTMFYSTAGLNRIGFEVCSSGENAGNPFSVWDVRQRYPAQIVGGQT